MNDYSWVSLHLWKSQLIGADIYIPYIENCLNYVESLKLSKLIHVMISCIHNMIMHLDDLFLVCFILNYLLNSSAQFSNTDLGQTTKLCWFDFFKYVKKAIVYK